MTSTMTLAVTVNKIMDHPVDIDQSPYQDDTSNKDDKSLSSDEQEDEDEFEDAAEFPLENGDMTLERALQEGQQAITYFFNNQFEEAKNLMAPYSNSCIYHSLGHSIFVFLEAILTVEYSSIAAASKALKHSLVVCNRFRRKNTFGESLGKIVRKNNFADYTELEAHAELCYAECLLLKSMLTFMEDETLSSFIKAGLKIRSCFNSYKDCQQILRKRTWENEQTKLHFESGVKMGIGTFNLMISLLPSRVIKLLEFIGFSGDKDQGLNYLTEGYTQGGIRQILCIMTLLGYNLIVLNVLSHREGDTDVCQEMLDLQLKKHPDGVWFLFFRGRLEFMRGNLDESISWYKKSWKSQNLWPQFHHVCFWELLWVHCLKCEWNIALEYITRLYEESKWSKCLYTYQKAALMIMMKDELTEDMRQECSQLMRDVPKYKQRIAGKSLPMEKFAIKKAERYFSQKETLILPVLELMFLWNLLKILKNFTVASRIMKLIEAAELEILANMKPSKYDRDNKALLLLLKGACLRHMGTPLQAIDCFDKVISMQKELVQDTYLVPYSIVELALTEWQIGNKEKAVLALEDAKKNYTGYSCESRLHFRIHTALTDFKVDMKNGFN